MDKKTFLYVRVSTLDQVGGAESQTRALLEWCKANKIDDYELFADHGISGAKESRPALNKMLEQVKAGNCKQVVVFQFSRFARSTMHLLKALEFFKSHSVRFHSISEAIDTASPLGVALFSILGCLSQLERELIRERVCAGLRNAVAKGKRIGRIRQRNSVLINSLLEAGMSFREIAKVAKCSHGSVWAQKKELMAQKALQKQKAEQQANDETIVDAITPPSQHA